VYVVFNEEMLAKKIWSYRKFALVLTSIITAVMAYFGVEAYFSANALLADHSTIRANVVQTEHREQRGKKGLTKDIYEVSYSFNLDTKSYSASFHTNAEKFSDIKSTGIVEIAYSNKNPANFERLELLLRQSDPKDLGKRIGLVFLLAYLFFSLIIWVIKSKLKKNIGQPMEVQD